MKHLQRIENNAPRGPDEWAMPCADFLSERFPPVFEEFSPQITG
jgi:hypothetical protein